MPSQKRKKPVNSVSTNTGKSSRSRHGQTTTTAVSRTARQSTGRPSTGRPKTSRSAGYGLLGQEIICAISESRGISTTVGLSIVDPDTGEAVMCQICDSQTYVKTIHKLELYAPSKILVSKTFVDQNSKLLSIIDDKIDEWQTTLTILDKSYWSERAGLEYIEQLAIQDDVEVIKSGAQGYFFAICCISAVLKYIEVSLQQTFLPHTLRLRFEPAEGTMMVDISTIRSLELVQNIRETKSGASLYGLLNKTLTPMGSRFLKSNILQPLTDPEILNLRFDALSELTSKEDVFRGVKSVLKGIVDVDKLLTSMIIVPAAEDVVVLERSVNQVLMLKQFLSYVQPIYEVLIGVKSELLCNIRELCSPMHIQIVQEMINETINEEAIHSSKPIDLRNQRVYAVKSGQNLLLDVARQTYKETMSDLDDHIRELGQEMGIALDYKYEHGRQIYIRIPASSLEGSVLPTVLINVFRKKKVIECQTLELVKLNKRISDAHQEVLLMSDETVQKLLLDIRGHIPKFLKMCESIAMLDMISSFAEVATSQDYVRPHIGDVLAVKSGRHPIKESIQTNKFIPNDVYATDQSRFQIITGRNMSGKSTYIKSIALMTVMCQVGSFVPAEYASFPIVHQLFSRVSTEDSLEASASTFAAEMREAAFILKNINRRSLAVIDELGRGTSTRDGLAIAISIAESLLNSHALIWFVTHFRDLAAILAERNGVVNLHLSVELGDDNSLNMLYKVAEGVLKDNNYGLELAKVVPLPNEVLEIAKDVAAKLNDNIRQKQLTSPAVVNQKRRKLILSLREHLLQAKNGSMEEPVLRTWLLELQREFVARMTALDKEMSRAESASVTDSVDEGRSK